MLVFSVSIQHTPWRSERVAALVKMNEALSNPIPPLYTRIDSRRKPPETPWHVFKTELCLSAWEWALSTEATHHLFLTDDLHLAPGFWRILNNIVDATGSDKVIGLLSNHPAAPRLFQQGRKFYRTNSWVVGPAYVVPCQHLTNFVAWYKALPLTEAPGGRYWYNDDSALNEWVTNGESGPRETWHPLPTPIEHRVDLESTVGHGDWFSRERVSWREKRLVAPTPEDGPGAWVWQTCPMRSLADSMTLPGYWTPGEPAPMLPLPSGPNG